MLTKFWPCLSHKLSTVFAAWPVHIASILVCIWHKFCPYSYICIFNLKNKEVTVILKASTHQSQEYGSYSNPKPQTLGKNWFFENPEPWTLNPKPWPQASNSPKTLNPKPQAYS